MALTFAQAQRLATALDLTPTELALVVAILDHPGLCPRDKARSAVCASPRSFDVHLNRVNTKLPPTIRISPIYPGGETSQYAKGRQGCARASGYALSNNWGRQHLLRLARGETLELEAARG